MDGFTVLTDGVLTTTGSGVVIIDGSNGAAGLLHASPIVLD